MVMGAKITLFKMWSVCFYFQDQNDDKKDKSKDKTKKVLVKTIELPIDAQVPGFSQHDLNAFMEQEVRFVLISANNFLKIMHTTKHTYSTKIQTETNY